MVYRQSVTTHRAHAARLSIWGVYSVWLRYAKVFQKTIIVNCFAPFAEPLIYLFAFGFGLGPLIRELSYNGKPVEYLPFIAPGMIAVGILFQSFFEGAYGTFVRLHFQKTWQLLLTTPLSFDEVLVGSWLWAATRGTLSGVVTASVAAACGVYPLSGILFSLPLIALGGLLFGAFGILSAALVRTIDQLNIPIFLFITPMFVLCGTYFPREQLPEPLRHIADFLPLSSLVDLLRWPLALPDNWPTRFALLAAWTALAFLCTRRALFPRIYP